MSGVRLAVAVDIEIYWLQYHAHAIFNINQSTNRMQTAIISAARWMIGWVHAVHPNAADYTNTAWHIIAYICIPSYFNWLSVLNI